MILVDTSVLIDFLQGGTSPGVQHLAKALDDGTPIALTPIVIQEVLQGARDRGQWRRLQAYLGSQELLLPAHPVESHVAAARIYFDCRRKGLTVRSSIDCLIAQIALENDAVLLHAERDFDVIARVRSLKIFA